MRHNYLLDASIVVALAHVAILCIMLLVLHNCEHTSKLYAIMILYVASLLPMTMYTILVCMMVINKSNLDNVHGLWYSFAKHWIRKHALPAGPMIAPVVLSLVNYANVYTKDKETSAVASATLVMAMLINSGGWCKVSDIATFLAQVSRSVSILVTAVSTQGVANNTGHYGRLPAITFNGFTITMELIMITFGTLEITYCLLRRNPQYAIFCVNKRLSEYISEYVSKYASKSVENIFKEHLRGREELTTEAKEEISNIICINRLEVGKPLLTMNLAISSWLYSAFFGVSFLGMMYAGSNMEGMYKTTMFSSAAACSMSNITILLASQAYPSVITYPPGVDIFSSGILSLQCKTVCGQEFNDLRDNNNINELSNAISRVERDTLDISSRHGYNMETAVLLVTNSVIKGVLNTKKSELETANLV